ncbi:alpha/beta hydrolase [uncultured Friedmanniella sp.]|uniref:alpha/beta hydrolase n=1 Tax=uncultured Friedmanniella sp. TaxID=335381 RepID=UPI0035CB3A41
MSTDAGRTGVPLVLLTGPLAPAPGTARLRSALNQRGPVLVPEVVLAAARAADLSTPALAVLAAVSASGADEAVLCGIGVGAMVALQVAATYPRRVSALVLCTAARPLAPHVRSVHRGVTGVLPARALQTLGGGTRQTLAALDQVRPLDYGPLAPLVTPPARVLYGARDPVNARASRRLAHTLPDGTAVAVPDSGPGWMWDEPERYVAAVTDFLQP